MIDQEFCDALEYALTTAFEKSVWLEASGFWCDGILIDTWNTARFDYKTMEVLTGIAFIGTDGQQRYNLKTYFGPIAQNHRRPGIRLTDCIPDNAIDEWFELDTERRTIDIKLL